MVFGIFSRKPAVAVEPTPISDPDKEQLHTTHDSNHHHHRVQQQLRTPSPSIASGSVGNPNLSPAFSSIRPHSNLSSPNGHSLLPATPSPPPTADPAALQALLLTIPPKILHEYTFKQLGETAEPLSPLTLEVLTSFFSALTPPPLLHCARCHKGFFDVENDDRSCTMPHEDDTALIEHVGKGNGRVAGQYETLWGCCGKTTEGDGDQGPPDGWCYEGRHTTDTKRARFRADSSIHDDKLTSCAKLRCHGPPPTTSSSPRNTRKRPRASMLEESSSEDDGSEGEHDSGMEEIVVAKKQKRSGSVAASMKSRKSITSIKGKGKGKANAVDTDMDEDTEMSVSGAENPLSTSTRKPKSKTAVRKPRSKAAAKAPTTPKKSASMPEVVVPTRAASATPRSRAKRGGALAKKLTEEVVDSEEEKPRKKRKVT